MNLKIFNYLMKYIFRLFNFKFLNHFDIKQIIFRTESKNSK